MSVCCDVSQVQSFHSSYAPQPQLSITKLVDASLSLLCYYLETVVASEVAPSQLESFDFSLQLTSRVVHTALCNGTLHTAFHTPRLFQETNTMNTNTIAIMHPVRNFQFPRLLKTHIHLITLHFISVTSRGVFLIYLSCVERCLCTSTMEDGKHKQRRESTGATIQLFFNGLAVGHRRQCER